MLIDYSQTINRYTLFGAYPLPRINELISNIYRYHIFSTQDLRSGYHLVPINPEDYPYTAFDASGLLYQFCRVFFGMKNDEIHPLTEVSTVHLSCSAIKAFEILKRDRANSAISAMDTSVPLKVETGASDCAIAASIR